MTTILHFRGFETDRAFRAHVTRRFTFALYRFEDQITLTEIFFKDLNGATKGGEDQQVLVRIRLRGRPEVVVEATSFDVNIAVSVAAKRSKRAVKRALKRQQGAWRKSLRNLASGGAGRVVTETG